MILFDFLRENFFEDKNNWILWLPIVFVIGILLGFYLNNTIIIHIIIVSFILLLFFRTKEIILILIFLFLGFFRTYYYINKYENNFLEESTGYVNVDGTVEKIELKKNYLNNEYKELLISVKNVYITDKSFENFKENYNNFKFPKKVIIRLKNKEDEVNYGYIKINTILYPVGEKIFSTSFDFKRYYFFKNIGAIGYKGKIIENIKQKETIWQKVSIFKNKFIKKEAKEIKSRSIDVVMALLTGNQKTIDKDVVEIINYAGISHILSISGLHMMTLMALIFFIVKWLLLRSEYIALNYNVFKIASIVSVIINFLYLALTGFSISAVRAYIMNVILLFAIILERFNHSLRSVMFVGFLMLFLKPDMLFNPSFQMSFIAVIALTGGYEFFLKMLSNEDTFLNKLSRHKFIFYFVLSFITSMLAELSTTPFSIYHFNNYTFYNVISNFITVPLTTFFILPVGILAIPLYFFDIEKIVLIPVCYVMDFILKISEYINNIPNSIIFIQSPSNISMCFMILGILWFCLWSKKWRLFGILFYLIGLTIIPFQEKPDVIINFKDKNFIVRNNKNNYFSTEKINYNSKTIINKLGQDTLNDIKDFKNKNCSKNCSILETNKNKYFYKKNNNEVEIKKYNNHIEYKVNNYKKIIKLKNSHIIYL